MVNYGIIGDVKARNISMGENVTVTISEQWDTINKWIDKNKSNITQYDELKHQIKALQTAVLSEKEKKSIYLKIKNIIGSIADSSQIISLLKEIL